MTRKNGSRRTSKTLALSSARNEEVSSLDVRAAWRHQDNYSSPELLLTARCVKFSNHLNTGLVWSSNCRFVSSCHMVQDLIGGLKTGLKKPVYCPKCPVFKWSARSPDFTIWILDNTVRYLGVGYSNGCCICSWHFIEYWMHAHDQITVAIRIPDFQIPEFFLKLTGWVFEWWTNLVFRQ